LSATVCVLLKGYPRLSETFIAQELLELQQAGLDLALVSLRHPTDKKRHPIHDEITAPITYLPEYLYQEPSRVLNGWLHARQLPGYAAAFRQFAKDLFRDFTPNRVRRFGQALVLAREMPAGTAILYAHFIHTPSSVANYARMMTGLPWSCSAHAKDIWTTPDWELREKIASTAFVATCTEVGARHLRSLTDEPNRVHLIYHGIDLARFPLFQREPSTRTGSDPANPLQIVTVGRAVAKKGIDTLLEALAKLPEAIHWRFTHIGGGELADLLKSLAGRLGLSDRIAWLGSQPQTKVISLYREADLFVLPCRITPSGDRDGLPNVLLEASSQGLTCISTPISGVTELLEDKKNALLVPPDDPDALANAIATLASDPQVRIAYGREAARKVASEFSHKVNTKQLIALFDEMGICRGGNRASTKADR
jgi:glycosyltransferase involved in cell wall biosynthesis